MEGSGADGPIETISGPVLYRLSVDYEFRPKRLEPISRLESSLKFRGRAFTMGSYRSSTSTPIRMSLSAWVLVCLGPSIPLKDLLVKG